MRIADSSAICTRQCTGSTVNIGARLPFFTTILPGILRGKRQIKSPGKVGRNETP